AAAAAADVEEISRALDRGEPDAAVVIGLCDRRVTLAEPALIGRREEIALFEEHFALARQGRGGLVLLEGPAGGGKTRLLAELATRALAQGARVFRGYGVEQAPPLPFQVLQGLCAEIVAAAEATPPFGETLRERLGSLREALGDAFPELA